MKVDKLFLAVMLIFLPVTAMAQQDSVAGPAGKGISPAESLAVGYPQGAGDQSGPVLAAPGDDPIGNEEEMDAADSSDFDYQEWLLMWPEQDNGRDYDPMDPREDAQEADTREE
jgi:hypothetical protein